MWGTRRWTPALVTVVVLVAAIGIGAPPAGAGPTKLWVGGGADNNWSTPGNWSPPQVPVNGESLIFGPDGIGKPTSNNDLQGLKLDSISFHTVGYALTGNAVELLFLMDNPQPGQTASTTVALGVSFLTVPQQGTQGISQTGEPGHELVLSGPMGLGHANTLVSSTGSVRITGVVSGPGGIRQTGDGLTTLTADNTYTGTTTIDRGAMRIDGAQPSSPVSVGAGLLTGEGTVGSLAVNGLATPDEDQLGIVLTGNGAGVFHAGNTTFSNHGVLALEVLGAGVGTGYDQLAVAGTFGVNDGLLVVDLEFRPTPGQTFTIVDNDGTDAVVGTFLGLPENQFFELAGSWFRISYVGGTGNDIVLRAVTPPTPSVITGAGPGGGPHVRTFGGRSLSFMGGTPDTGAGTTVVAGDLYGSGLDGIITGTGPGITGQVHYYLPDGTPTAYAPIPYPHFKGGINVAAGDFTGFGFDFLVTAPGPGGGPHVRVLDSDGFEVSSFMAYAPEFTGGVSVATGDVDGDGFDDIITGAGPGAGSHVRIFEADGTPKGGFSAYGPAFRGGVYVAAADVNGDGQDEIITGPGPGGGPHVRALQLDGLELAGFYAYAPQFGGGVHVGGVRDGGTGRDLIVTGTAGGGGPHVRTFDQDGIEHFGVMAYSPAFGGGVFVAGGVLNEPGP